MEYGRLKRWDWGLGIQGKRSNTGHGQSEDIVGFIDCSRFRYMFSNAHILDIAKENDSGIRKLEQRFQSQIYLARVKSRENGSRTSLCFPALAKTCPTFPIAEEFHNLHYWNTCNAPVTMVKKRVGALEKVDADL